MKMSKKEGLKIQPSLEILNPEMFRFETRCPSPSKTARKSVKCEEQDFASSGVCTFSYKSATMKQGALKPLKFSLLENSMYRKSKYRGTMDFEQDLALFKSIANAVLK